MNLREIAVEPVPAVEEPRFQVLMQAHPYPGALPKIGHTRWYIASLRGEWLVLLGFSAAAWKCAARDAWIGWEFRHQYDRLPLIANHSRFLILPGHHDPNLASRVLARCAAPTRWLVKLLSDVDNPPAQGLCTSPTTARRLHPPCRAASSAVPSST